MRKPLSLMALVVTLVAGVATKAEEPTHARIEWKTGLWQAYKQAQSEKKPLVLYIYVDKSEWCDKMNATWADAGVQQQFAGKAIFVRVNAEKDEDPRGNVRRLLDQLNLERYPTVCVLQPYPDRLDELGRVRGYFAPDGFVPRLRKALGLPPSLTPPRG